MSICRALILTMFLGYLLGSPPVPGADRPDVLIADFEGKDYGAWQVTGEAFGAGPARGTLPNQMRVSGFEGKGLVNSYYRGDGTTGTLTSPPFRIERKYIHFLVGGGKHPGRTCINLLVEGRVVRTATGPNDRPGGSERLDWASWDVAELEGQSARIEIVDQEKGGWGHINVDHILMSDRPKPLEPARREFVVTNRYLHLPVRSGAALRQVSVLIEGRLVRQFEIELAEAEPDFWAAIDLSAWKGKKLAIETQLFSGSRALEAVEQGDELKGTENLYREKYRPQFHFSPRRGWTNDPNGLVYYRGEYHLFFQHNPFGTQWGNMTWGHAVSRDLVHWTELDDAIHPDRLGTIFSGSAVVDHANTAGFQTGEEKVLVCVYTSAGGTSAWSQGQPFTQSLAYSNDRGRTWTNYAHNPVLKHVVGSNRDPKVIWHEPTQRWIMALYLDKNDYGLFSSPDLRQWSHLHSLTVPGCSECPDLFPVPVDGDGQRLKWVFTGANGRYLIGTFDGQKFTPDSGPHEADWGNAYYAVQTFSNGPEEKVPEEKKTAPIRAKHPSGRSGKWGLSFLPGRRIQMAWMRGGQYPGMPFNQQMSFPCELTLRTFPEGLRICRNPVREIQSLRVKTHAWKDLVVKPGENPLEPIQAELLDIEAEIRPADAAEVGFELRGQRLAYSVKDRSVSFLGRKAEVVPADGRLRLRILVDRTSVEVFADGGKVPMSFCWLPDPGNRRLGLFATGGPATVAELKVHELRSAWMP